MNEKILKDITFGSDAKDRIMSGVDKLANPVGSSMGYRGRTVLVETEYGMPEPTQDGYKILKAIHLTDPVEAMACEIAKQASQRTVDFAGDSTTLTVVLLQAFLKNSIEAVKNGKSAIDVKNEIEKSRDLILKYLDDISIPVNDKLIYDIAYTSSHSDEEIAKVVADAFIKAGEFGSVSHLRSINEETYLDYNEGILLESGYASDLFVNNFADRTCEFINPFVVCSNIIFKTPRQILPFLAFAVEQKRPIVVIADWQDTQSYGVRDLVLSNVLGKEKMQWALVNCPSFGTKRRDLISDLALRCGSQMITSLSGDDFTGREISFLGSCDKIVIGKSDTIITPFQNDDIQTQVDSKIAELQSQIKETKNTLEKKYLSERVSKLYGGISIIKVGSIIESELQEKIDRVDDAVCAVRSAKEEGVVAGGGITLLNALYLKDIDKVTLKSIVAPSIKILENANVKHNLNLNWFQKLFKKPIFNHYQIYNGIGYDVKNYKCVNMIEAGIVNATKAEKHALINAVSASNTLLLTNFLITNRRSNG
jgi:chaperonin GroEL